MLLLCVTFMAVCGATTAAEAFEKVNMGGCADGGRAGGGRADGGARSHEIMNLQLRYVWPEYGFTYDIHDQALSSAFSAALSENDTASEPVPQSARAPSLVPAPKPAPAPSHASSLAPAPRAYRNYQMLSWAVGPGKQRYYLRILDDGSLYDPHSDRWLQNEKLALAIEKINASA